MRAVFIDRDGVICRNRGDHVKSRAEFVFLPGALEALARLARLDLKLVVVTNQAIINRRIVPAGVVEDIHHWMIESIERAGGRIDRVMVCPHRPDEHCACRKPQPGLLLQAAQELGVTLGQSYLIGDTRADMRAGQAVGCRCFLVLTGQGFRQWVRGWLCGERGFIVVPNLKAAARAISRLEHRRTFEQWPSPEGSGVW